DHGLPGRYGAVADLQSPRSHRRSDPSADRVTGYARSTLRMGRHMSDQLKESLSAVMDGEADDFELRRALDEMSNDPALRGVWERYHLIGSALRREGRGTANSLGARFWDRIDAGEGTAADDLVESTVARPGSRKPRIGQWGQRVAGVAVAAGVAAAVI